MTLSALLLPAAVIFGLVILVPVVRGIIASFQDAHLGNRGDAPWVGLDNYIEIFSNGTVLTYLGNSVQFVFCTVAILIIVGMALALLLNSPIPGRRIARSIYLLPWIVPSVVVALLWSWIFQPQYGILNYFLSSIGLVAPDQQWLTDTSLAMPAVIVAAVWRELPLMTLLILAALQSVPGELLEAARMDGARSIARFWYVTFPAIRPALTVAILLSVINNFQSFTLIYTMTGGGPLDSTTTLSIGTYVAAFKAYDIGIASAIGVVWLVLLVLLSSGLRALSARKEA